MKTKNMEVLAVVAVAIGQWWRAGYFISNEDEQQDGLQVLEDWKKGIWSSESTDRGEPCVT